MWPGPRRLHAWLLLNGFVLRPYFVHRNWEDSQVMFCPGIMDGPHNTTGLKIIVAGLGRTGTHAMNLALETMGYKTFGTYESVYYMPELWVKNLSTQHLIFMMRSCRLDAFITEPHYDLLWRLLPASPDARVILTLREWEPWRNSNLYGTRLGIGYWLMPVTVLNRIFSHAFCDWLPYQPMWHLADKGQSFMLSRMTTLLLENCVTADHNWVFMVYNYQPDYNGAYMYMLDLFHQYHEDVRFFVPSDRLLEFDVKQNGWAELALFLGRAPPASGLLPKTGSGSAHSSSMRFSVAPGRWICFWALAAASVAANWAIFAVAWASLGRGRIVLHGRAKAAKGD